MFEIDDLLGLNWPASGPNGWSLCGPWMLGRNSLKSWEIPMRSSPIGSMYAIYGNIYHQYSPFILAYIPAPWIRHGS